MKTSTPRNLFLLGLLLILPFNVLSADLYIDPVAGSDTTGTGSAFSPFMTLTAAFAASSTLTPPHTLHVVNNAGAVHVKLLAQATISSTMTIQPTDSSHAYTFSLVDFDGSTPVTDDSAIRVTSGVLTVNGASFSEDSTSPVVQNFFFVGNAQLKLKDAKVEDIQSLEYLVRSVGTSSSASKVTITNLRHIDSSPAFSFIQGTHSVSGMWLEDNQIATPVFKLQNSALTLANTQITEGQALLVSTSAYSQIYMNNVTVSDYSGNGLVAEDPYYVELIGCSFEDLTLTSTDAFILINGTGTPSPYVHASEQIVFESVQSISPMIEIKQALASVSFDSLLMEDVTKSLNLDKAACFAVQGAALTVTNSDFKKINSNCIMMDAAALVLTGNLFDNTNLASTITNANGVTWLVFHQGTNNPSPGNTLRLTSNAFVNNTLAPANGGAVRITGSFSGFIKFEGNSFEDNVASFSGGAVYVENFNQDFTANNEHYSGNVAVLGAALLFVNSGSTPGFTGAAVRVTNTQFFDNINTGNSAWPVLSAALPRLTQSGNTYVGNV